MTRQGYTLLLNYNRLIMESFHKIPLLFGNRERHCDLLRNAWEYVSLKVKSLSRIHVFLVGVGLSILPVVVQAQQAESSYTIAKDGKQIGWLKLQKTLLGERTVLSLISEVKTRVIMEFIIAVNDIATFEHGRLIHSTMVRKTNNQIKLNKQTKLFGSKYQVTQEGETAVHDFPMIKANLLSLYFFEPAGLNEVYSDLHEKFLGIKHGKDGSYEVRFPGGNRNLFYYTGGRCTLVKVRHSFYSVDVVLN